MAKRPNAKRGAHYKARTRQWLRDHGYQFAEMEVVRWVFRGKQRGTASGVDLERFGLEPAAPSRGDMFPVKRDQFASDLLAIKGEELIFIQVKGGDGAGTGTFPDARRKFAEFSFPSFVKLWIVAWPTRATQPRIIDCRNLPAPPQRERNQETFF